MTIFIQQVINGLMLGSVYALLALGYTMVYGIIKLINLHMATSICLVPISVIFLSKCYT